MTPSPVAPTEQLHHQPTPRHHTPPAGRPRDRRSSQQRRAQGQAVRAAACSASALLSAAAVIKRPAPRCWLAARARTCASAIAAAQHSNHLDATSAHPSDMTGVPSAATSTSGRQSLPIRTVNGVAAASPSPCARCSCSQPASEPPALAAGRALRACAAATLARPPAPQWPRLRSSQLPAYWGISGWPSTATSPSTSSSRVGSRLVASLEKSCERWQGRAGSAQGRPLGRLGRRPAGGAARPSTLRSRPARHPPVPPASQPSIHPASQPAAAARSPPSPPRTSCPSA